jgi:hypothetical protein
LHDVILSWKYHNDPYGNALENKESSLCHQNSSINRNNFLSVFCVFARNSERTSNKMYVSIFSGTDSRSISIHSLYNNLVQLRHYKCNAIQMHDQSVHHRRILVALGQCKRKDLKTHVKTFFCRTLMLVH